MIAMCELWHQAEGFQSFHISKQYFPSELRFLMVGYLSTFFGSLNSF